MGFYDHHVVMYWFHLAFKCGCDNCLIEGLRRV